MILIAYQPNRIVTINGGNEIEFFTDVNNKQLVCKMNNSWLSRLNQIVYDDVKLEVIIVFHYCYKPKGNDESEFTTKIITNNFIYILSDYNNNTELI